MHLNRYLVFTLLSFSFFKSICQVTGKQAAVSYPVPITKNLLFYIQRSTNTNTIVYELNFKSKDSVNKLQPVKVYWIKYAEGNKVTNLSMLEKKYAYGVSAEVTNAKKRWFKIHIKAYNKIDIYVMNSKAGGAYHAYVPINGKLSKLSRIFFNIDGGTFWKPNVTYIELLGQDIKTNKPVTERFKP